MRSTLAKRKAADATSPPRKKAKLVHQRNAQISSSESSSSSSSSTSSSSSEESSTSSDSTSDSSSDSSDSSTGSNVLNTHPTARPIRTAKSSGLDLRNAASSQCQLQVPSRKTVVLPSAPLVPPGHGKSSTHSRNIRRRRKKQFEREATSQPPVEVARSSVNATPLGVSAANSTPTSERTGSANENAQPSMMSLSNKNKRKGFKKAMASTTPQRIAFDDADATTLISALIPGKPASASRPASPSKQPRLIPPSEKQALGLLPPRMFVTSVDVEEGMWPHNMNGWDKKRKKKQRDTWGQDNGAEAEEEVHIELPYDDEDAAEPEGDVTATGAVDWDDVERRWDELAAVIPEQLASGTFIGWKEFGVHPVRLAPEMVVNIAKVTTVDASTSSVAVRTLSREASFGRVGPVMVDEEDLGEDVVHQVANLGTLGWKVVAMY